MKTSILPEKEKFMSSVSCLTNSAILILDQAGLYVACFNVSALFLPGLLFPRLLYQIPSQVSLLCIYSRDTLKFKKSIHLR